LRFKGKHQRPATRGAGHRDHRLGFYGTRHVRDRTGARARGPVTITDAVVATLTNMFITSLFVTNLLVANVFVTLDV
jgi:hypothetical protein